MKKARRTIVLFVFAAIVTYTLLYLQDRDKLPESLPFSHGKIYFPPSPPVTSGSHPVHQLVVEAEAEFEKVQKRQSKTLEEAVTEYRRRYRMPPPPNFDKWYEFAKSKNVQLIDEYDSIYHNLLPFWAVEPHVLRERVRQAIGFDNAMIAILVRNGKVVRKDGGGDMYKWHREATPGMLKHFIRYLPDMDLAFNVHDEPRIVVQHDELDKHVRVAKTKNIPKAFKKDLLQNMWSAPGSDMGNGDRIREYKTTRFNKFAHQPTWSNSKISCPLDSAARACFNDSCIDNTASYTQLPLGIIQNVTAFSDICNSPSLESTFGFFDRPNAFDVAHELIPVFSQSKVSSFQDILYPSPWYYEGKVTYHSIYDTSWERKADNLFWRGSTTGGYSRNGGWRRQHRQLFLQKLLPGQTAHILQLDNTTTADTDDAADDITTTTDGHDADLPVWRDTAVPIDAVAHYFDVQFTFIGQCDPGDCDAQRNHFRVSPHIDMFDALKSKFLLDIDGNAFSGRYHAWLQSNSLVFKLALFREWHDEWLRPWVHYVPLSLRGDEYAELLRFFADDEVGRKIAPRLARQGKRWAEKVLRKEDMEVWYFRLLLEYGRLIDDDRYNIGFQV